MFKPEELAAIMQHSSFISDFSAVRQSLVNWRLSQPILFEYAAENELVRFAEAVLASAPYWNRIERFEACNTAAEIAEALAVNDSDPERA